MPGKNVYLLKTDQDEKTGRQNTNRVHRIDSHCPRNWSGRNVRRITPIAMKITPPKTMQPGHLPDCGKCQHGRAVEFGLFQCTRRNAGPTPQPNCNKRKVNCVYYTAKTNHHEKI